MCEPLGIKDTTFLPTDEQRERIVKMHTRTDDRNDEFEMEEGCLFENYPETHMAGAAGLASTLDDYVKFAMMLLNGGKVGDKQIISEESYKELSSPQHPYNFTHHEGWGLGVRIIKEENYPYLLPVGAFGWSGAYGTHFFVDPVNKIVAVMMKNSKIDGGAANETANNMEKAIYTSFK